MKMLKMRKNFFVFLIIVLVLCPCASLRSMQSANYIIDKDSINFGGTEESESKNFKLSDTMGEVGTGETGEKCASMNLDGTDYMQVSHSASLDITNEITIGAWIKTSYTGDIQMILEKATNQFNSGYNLLLTSTGFEGRLYPAHITSTKDVRDGQWHYVAMTNKNVVNGLNLYVDGVAVATADGVAIGANASNLGIGKRIFDNTLPFKGLIDDVRIYNRALSAAEMENIYKGNDIDGTGLVGQWNMDEATLGTDSVVNGSFEGGFTEGIANSWSSSGNGTFREDVSIAQSGSAQRILSTDNAEIHQAIPVEAGHTYRFTAWIYIVSACSQDPKMELSTDNVIIASANKSLVGAWQRIERDYTPVNSGNLNFHIGMLSSGGTGKYIVDDVSVKEVKIGDQSGNANDAMVYGGTFSNDFALSTCKLLNVGYREMLPSYIAISNPNDVAMTPDIGGVNGGTGNGAAVWNIKTDNAAGYQISVRANASPALQSGSYSFADYTSSSSGVPDFTWGINASDSEFGYSVEGDNTVAKFLDNGSVCNVGTGNVSDKCWLGFLSSDSTITSSAFSNHPLGTDTTIKFRAESGNAHIQPEGTYTATIVVTAVEL